MLKIYKTMILLVFGVCLGMTLYNIYELGIVVLRKIAKKDIEGIGTSEFSASHSSRFNTAFLKKHIPAYAVCYLWKNPKTQDEIITECEAADINYFLYPVKVKYGSENLKTHYGFIICAEANVEILDLYLCFFDMDKDFAKIAENGDIVIYKKLQL